VSLAWVARDAAEKYVAAEAKDLMAPNRWKNNEAERASSARLFMKLIKNTGSDRVIDELRQTLAPPSSLDLASPRFPLRVRGAA